jgi:glycosyltransferase involved in cell wall biosynthesis
MLQDRVLHLVVYLDSETRGGAETATATLVGALDPSIRVTVMGFDETLCTWIASHRSNASIEIVPSAQRRNLRALRAHRRALRRIRPDLFQASLTWMPSCLWPLLVATTIPGLLTIAVEHSSLAPRARRMRALKRLVSKRLSGHVAVSDRTARDVEAALGLAGGAVRTIHNGVTEPPVTTRPRVSDGRVVGTVARLESAKGIDLFIDALVALPDVTGVIIGTGPDAGALQRTATDHGIADRVVFVGWADDARTWLPTFDVFVLPSRLEALPMSIVEAMFAGVAVVATDVGGVAELIDDGVSGLLVPPDDPPALAAAIRDLLEDPLRRRAIAGAAERRARAELTADVMARAYEALYAELLRAPRRTTR